MKTVRLLLLLFVMQLCIHNNVSAQAKKTIGLLMDDFNASRWKYDSSLIALKVKAAGYDIMIRVCDSDTAVQHQQAKDLLKAGVCVLVVIPANSMAAANVVRTAHKTNVPVIAYDRLILNCDLDYYISFNNEKVGELQAEYILKKINYKGSIMLMNGPEFDANSLLFKKGQMNILKPYIDSGAVKIIYDRYLSEWTSMEAYMEGNDFLSSYTGKIDGVIAAADLISEGIIDALTIFRPNEKIYITGQDASVIAYYNILENTQGMTVYKPLDLLATKAAELACKLAAKSEVEDPRSAVFNGVKNVPYIKLEPLLITKENLETLLDKSNYLSEEYLKGRK